MNPTLLTAFWRQRLVSPLRVVVLAALFGLPLLTLAFIPAMGFQGLGSALGLIPPLLVRGLIDQGIPAGQRIGAVDPVVPYVLGLVAAPLAAGLLGLLQQYLTVRVGQGILSDLRNRLYTHLQHQSLRFYTTTRSGEIVARVADDVAAVEGVVTGTLVEAVRL